MIRLLFLSFFLATSLFGHRTEDTGIEKISLQLHWKYQFEFAGFIAAKEKGFYKDVGLDVTLKEYHYGTDIESDVLNGISDYGIYNSSTLISYLQGKPVKLVASFFKRAALVLITKLDIKTPQDLIGKTIMASTKDDFILNFKPYLDTYNVNVDEVKLTKHTYSVDDFLDNNVDAMTAFVSDQVYKLDKQNVKYNILDPSNDNLYVLQMEMFTSEKEVQKHPSRVINFKNASIKGWQYALTHQEEMIEIIQKKYVPHISKEDLRREAKGITKLILPYTYDIGSIDNNFLHKQMEFFKAHYPIDKTKELDEYVFNYEYLDKNLYLTDIEKNYIKENPVINVCVHRDEFPIDGMKDGKMTGIMSDIFNDISQTTSLSFRAVTPASNKVLQSMTETQACQVLSIYASNSKKFPSLKPTQPFMGVHFTLISKLDKSFIFSPEELHGKTIVVQKQSYKSYLLSLYPSLDIIVVEKKSKMVNLVLDSKVYAIASLDFQADYIIDKYGYGKLKINGFLAKENPISTSIGVQKSDPVLYGIIQKALQKISQYRIENILNGWKISRYHETTDYSLVFKIVLTMGFILLLMVYYQRKLKSFNRELETQVAQQTKQLREVNESLEKSVKEKVQELIKKDEILTLQSKQAVMGEMISMIAHQWRQPLNTITLQISNMQLKYLLNNKIDKAEILKTFDNINSTIIYLSDTVDDFKTYFRKDKELVSVKLSEVIDKALNLIQARLKDIKVELSIDDNMYAMVYFNELVQVLLNILNNAIDAYEACPKCNKKIEISLVNMPNEILINIKDNAGGIEQEYLEKLFEPYFSTKGKNGTGLGLYMSKMIIEKQFNGKLAVESAEGTSTFTVSLPISCPVSQEKAQEEY